MADNSDLTFWQRVKEWASDSEYHPPDVEDMPIKIVTVENDFIAELTVPTRQSGATISQSGWRVGGDTIARTTSSGTVEPEPYEDFVSLFSIYEEYIELGVLLGKENSKVQAWKRGTEPNRHIRIRLDEITDVRRTSEGQGLFNYPTIVFETADDVYQIKIHWTGGNIITGRGDNFNDAWVDEVIEIIREKSGGQIPD